MISTISFLFLFRLLSLFWLLHNGVTCSFAPLCHNDERLALWNFKNTFIIDPQASGDPLAYPKVESWELKKDCCLWDGVTCDVRTGHVTGLDFSSCYLHGSINSTSSLFHLVHLRTLNLADNHFNYSQIPSEVCHLSKLTYFNLSASSFAGQIPSNISQFPNLSIIDFTRNTQLTLKNPDFGSLIQNLTKLEVLRLSHVDIPSIVPDVLANLSSLKDLDISRCGVYGEFPIRVFLLPNLQTLKVAGNLFLTGYLPKFNCCSQLQTLILSETSFLGKLPKLIGSFTSLKSFDIAGCGFYGKLPASLGNASKLELMNLGYNDFELTNSSSLSWIGKLSRLNHLGLSRISFQNEFPPFFANITQITTLFLDECQINSQIPYWLMNMTQLDTLSMSSSQLHGVIPDSFFQLINLRYLDLSSNNLSGTVELDEFLSKLTKLDSVDLSYNNLSLLDNDDFNATIGKFSALGFASCKLSRFPRFLNSQDELEQLYMSNNNIQGLIPKWFWNSTTSLQIVELQSNFLTGFEQNPKFPPWPQIAYLDLSDNMLRGPLPIPPPSIEVYLIGSNNLDGEISPVICTLNALYHLDLKHNNFTGTIPQCLGNFGNSIKVLELEGNRFHGKFPVVQSATCNIRMFNIESNNFEGKVPRSLANCPNLQALLLGSNKINDVFPTWLSALKKLKVLILRSNQFHGALDGYMTNLSFPNLHIIDLSHNNFSGKLPAQYFLSWNAMKIVGADQSEYLAGDFSSSSSNSDFVSEFIYSITLTNKGTNLEYAKVLEALVAIDLSSNNFEGGIPEVIGNLKGLRLLNLSNNNLNGMIPTSLGNLTQLESLDLSGNNLTGKIPRELTNLGFLAAFNVSRNHLMGPIPHGKQFDTFGSSSYQNNSGLCGDPLPKKCESSEASPPSRIKEDQNSESPFEFGWKEVAIGYGCGLIIGALLGHIVVVKKYEWLLKTFKIGHGVVARGRGRGRGRRGRT